MLKTIKEVQSEYTRVLSGLAPSGYSPVVALLDKNGRKKRKDAAAHNWDPASGQVSVTFIRKESPSQERTSPPRPSPESVSSVLPPALTEAIRALDSAERRGSFVALKWFRDQFLPGHGASWATAPGAGHEVIKDAIERGIFFTSKIPNPKSPAHPTTVIRLNRQSSDVQQVLSSQPSKAARSFHPVQIAGEPMSATVIRDRR